MFKELEYLIKTIRDRKNLSPENSYTYKLLKNRDLNIEKVKEEIAELIRICGKKH